MRFLRAVGAFLLALLAGGLGAITPMVLGLNQDWREFVVRMRMGQVNDVGWACLLAAALFATASASTLGDGWRYRWIAAPVFSAGIALSGIATYGKLVRPDSFPLGAFMAMAIVVGGAGLILMVAGAVLPRTVEPVPQQPKQS